MLIPAFEDVEGGLPKLKLVHGRTRSHDGTLPNLEILATTGRDECIVVNTTSASPAPDYAALGAWEGRSREEQDTIVSAPLAAMAATLDRDDPAPGHATDLPPLWHWLFFRPNARRRDLGPDGHPSRGGFLPPVPLPRRMWAGGRLQWHAPLAVGDVVRRTFRIESVTHKAGRSGDIVFVLVRHELHGPEGLALTEEQDIVYRPAPGPGDGPAARNPAPDIADVSRDIFADTTLLFRYSALTFNSHRIHYDRTYATQSEGYPGLVVHGPLIAPLLADLVRGSRPGRRLARFSFRAVRPSFDGHRLRLNSACGDAVNRLRV